MIITFHELNHRYLNEHLARKATYREYVRLHEQYFCGLTEHPTRPQLKAWHMSLADIPAHANKALGYLKALYNWAMNEGLWEHDNPAQGIKRHVTFSRERVMDTREIRLLLDTLDMIIPTKDHEIMAGSTNAYLDRRRAQYKAWFVCRFLVPCRITELCTMRRDAVDAYGKWTKARTKNGRVHVIHIPRQALALLQALPKESEFFFTGQGGRPLSEDAVRKTWLKWRADLGLTNLWLLDYRRTLATYLYRIQKVDDLTAKAILGHYDSRPVAIYTRLDYDYLATTIQGYADWLMALPTTPLEVPHDTQLSFYAPAAVPIRGLRPAVSV